MSAKIGESLKRIVDVAHEPAGGNTGEFALSNLNRLAVYQSILELVLARSGTVSHLCGSNRKAAQWHLSALVDEGFVEMWDFGRAVYYAPAAAVPDDPTAELLKMAAGKPETGILWATMTHPGSSAASFPKPSVVKLAEAGLILLILDGKAKRQYPGAGLKTLSGKMEAGYKSHKSLLMRLCQKSDVKYQANPLKDGSLDFRIITHSGDFEFVIPAKPFENSIARRAKLYNLL
jgi:hypothetical protein